MLVIHTPRQTLHCPTTTLLASDERGPHTLSRHLGVRVTPEWPPGLLRGIAPIFLHMLSVAPDVAPWLGWYWVANADTHHPATLIGMGGFKGPPDATHHHVEVGYSLLPSWQGRGLATEAVSGLCEWALSRPDVKGIRAHVRSENTASIRVLEKNAFTYADTVPDEEHPGDTLLRFIRTA